MPVRQVTVIELAARLARGERPVLLDVRRHDELAMAQLDNVMHIPLDELTERVDELDPAAEYVVYCHHGVRSLSAAVILQAAGIAHVASLKGGIDAWSQLVDPTVPRY